MSDPLTIAGGVLGGKKIIGLSIGMIGAVTTIANKVDWIKYWPLLLGVLFIGGAYRDIYNAKESMQVEHGALYKYIDAEFATRDVKIDLTYNRAIL